MSLHIWQPSWSVNLFQIQNCNIFYKTMMHFVLQILFRTWVNRSPCGFITNRDNFVLIYNPVFKRRKDFLKLLTAVFLWAWFQHVYKYTNNLNSLNFQLAMTLHPGLPRARDFRVSSIWIQSRFWTLLQLHQQQ